MQSASNDIHEGINPGAGCRAAGPLGTCSGGEAGATAGEARRGRNRRARPGPDACEHRHHFHRWRSVRKSFGFDDGSLRRSQWQLVPLGETREVTLLWDRLNPKRVFVEHPDLADVDESGDRYLVTGLKTGRTGLHAANARGICWSELEVTIRQIRRISVAFHFLEDQRHKTSRARSAVDKLLAGVNDILGPQTCITFGLHPLPEAPFRVGADLGDFVDPHDHNLRRWCNERILQTHTMGMVNIFFVWRVVGAGGDATGAEMLDNLNCFVGDVTKKDASRALAHEFGHCLTRFDREDLYHDPEGHSTDTECLMERFASGTRISRAEADIMYRTAADSTGAK